MTAYKDSTNGNGSTPLPEYSEACRQLPTNLDPARLYLTPLEGSCPSAKTPRTMKNKGGYVYILTNERHTVLYTGVTSDLARRIEAHRAGTVPGFTLRYNATRLVYVERHENIESAIIREKQIKAGSRKRKIALIEQQNPQWLDLSDQI